MSVDFDIAPHCHMGVGAGVRVWSAVHSAAIVEINASTRSVENDVVLNRRQPAFGLEDCGTLLLGDAELGEPVARDGRAARLVAIRRVRAHARHGRAARVAPERDGRLAEPGELGVDNARGAVEAGEEDGQAVNALEDAALDGEARRALKEERSRALDGPVAGAARAIDTGLGLG